MNEFSEIFSNSEQKILAKEYPPRSLLPSESQLIKIYGVSRKTIRKALNLLTTKGYIQKKQGKGPIVLNRNHFSFPISGPTSYKELQETQRIPGKTIVHTLEEIEVIKSLNEAIGWGIGAPIWRLIRERKINGETVILDINYLLKEVALHLTPIQTQGSTYEYFENELSLTIAYTQKEITIEKVIDIMKTTIDLRGDTYAIVVRSLVHLEGTRCFGCSKPVHQLDKFHFVESARRRKVWMIRKKANCWHLSALML